MIWLLFVAMQLRATESKSFCQMLLAPHASSQDFLADSLYQEFGEKMALARLQSTKSYADQLREVTQDLVKQNRITQTQADTVFAEKLLGRFAPIFLRYTLAELIDRGFGEDAITLFMQNFSRAYLPKRQVEFAIAVARRMSLTVNDDPSIASAQGVVQFAEFARALGVSATDYAQFLQAWSFVRESHANTIVQFILLNVLNAGQIFEAQIEAELESQVKAPVEHKWWSEIWRGPLRPQAQTFESVSARLLDLKSIPKHLTEVRGISEGKKTPPFLERLFNESSVFSKDSRTYLIGLESVPPMARQLILSGDFKSMNHELLRQITFSTAFKDLDAELQERGKKILADLDLVKSKIDQMLRLRFEVRLASPDARTQGPNTAPDEKKIAAFARRFEDLLDKTIRSTDKSEALVTSAFNQAYTDLRGDYPERLNTEEFLSIATGAATRILSLRHFTPSRALINCLRGTSQQIELSDEQAKNLTKFLSNFEINTYNNAGEVDGRMKINGDGELNDVLSPAAWGKRVNPNAKIKVLDYFAQSPALVTLMSEIQSLLSAQGAHFDNPRRLMEDLAEMRDEQL